MSLNEIKNNYENDTLKQNQEKEKEIYNIKQDYQ